MHRGILIYIYSKAWCGSYHIVTRGQLPIFPVAHCKTAIQLYQEMLHDASQYKDFVQCELGVGKTWHLCFNVQGYDGVSLYQQCGIQVWFCLDEIKRFLNGNKKKYALD